LEAELKAKAVKQDEAEKAEVVGKFPHDKSRRVPKGAENAAGYRIYSGKVSTAEFLRIALHKNLARQETPEKWWNGVDTIKEVHDIQHNGYIPPAGKLVKAPQFDTDTQSLYMERAVIGQFPDVAAYLRGEPESMLNMVFDPQPTPTIHLAAMMNVTGGVDGDTQQKHANDVYRCIRALQDAGNQVTLTALFYNIMKSDAVEELQVEILQEGQVLSQATLGARFHLCFYRVCWFNWAKHHFGGCGGSIRPAQFVDEGQRIVIPSSEFMPAGESIMDIVQKGVKAQRAAAG
jgi:hypothetical protein